MKRLTGVLAMAAMLVMMLMLCASAGEVDRGACGEKITWVLDDDGTLTLSGLGKTYNYSGLRSPEFSDRSIRDKIKKIVVEEGITGIDENVFSGLGNVKSVSLPTTLEFINDDAFNGCSKLNNITIPETVSYLGRDVFYGTALYGDEANWQDGIFYVSCYAAYAKGKLYGDLRLRDGTVGAAHNLFFGSTEIDSIYFPASFRYFHGGNFGTTLYRLKKIIVDGNNKYFSTDVNGTLYNKDKTVLYYYPMGNRFETFVIPDSVEVIEGYAFYIAEVKNVIFGSNVKKIGEYAFVYAKNTTELYLPASIEFIGEDAFDDGVRLNFAGSREKVFDAYVAGQGEMDAEEEADFREDLEDNERMEQMYTYGVKFEKRTDFPAAVFADLSETSELYVHKDLSVTLSGTVSLYSYQFTLLDTKTGEYIYRNEPISPAGMEIPADTLDAEIEYKFWVGTFKDGKAISGGVAVTLKLHREGWDSEVGYPDDPGDEPEPEPVHVEINPQNINTAITKQIGRSYIDVRLDLGEPKKAAYYLGGAAYFFLDEKYALCYDKLLLGYGDDNTIFADEDSFEEPYPFAKTSTIVSTADRIILNFKNRKYTVDELSEHVGVNIETEYSEFHGCYIHYFYYNGLRIEIENYDTDIIYSDDVCSVYALLRNGEAEGEDYTGWIGHTTTMPSSLKNYPTEGVFTYKAGMIYKVNPSASGVLVIPEYLGGTPVNGIASGAFEGCKNITKIVFPGNIAVIDDELCENMTSLEYVELPINLKFIGENAFRGCTSLKKIDIPSGVQNIRSYAFKDCTSLVSAFVPESVAVMGAHVFQNCTSLENLLFEANIITGGAGNFSNCPKLRNVIFGSENTAVRFLSLKSRMGDEFAGGEAKIEHMMILSDMTSQSISTSDSIMKNVQNIYYPYKYTKAFDSCKNSTVYEQFNPYNYPRLYEFLDSYDSVIITINDKLIIPKTLPFIENDYTLAPARDMLESLGMSIKWDEATKTVTAKGDRTVVTLTIGSKTATVNGKEVTLDAPARIINGRTLVPVRFLSENLGANVKWDESMKRVIIKYKFLRNLNIVPQNIKNAKSVKVADYGYINNISVKKTSGGNKVSFDYINYLNIPVQILVYDAENMIYDSRVTGLAWQDMSFTAEIAKSIEQGKYLFEVAVTDKVLDDSELVKRLHTETPISVTVPDGGFISITFPANGTDAHNIMKVIMIMRSLQLAMELDGLFEAVMDIELVPKNIETMFNAVDWNTFTDSASYNDVIAILNNIDNGVYDSVIKPKNIGDFTNGVQTLLNDKNVMNLCSTCLEMVNKDNEVVRIIKNFVDDALVDAANTLFARFDVAYSAVQACSTTKQLVAMYEYEKKIDLMDAAEFLRLSL